jgi:hypothetical protein
LFVYSATDPGSGERGPLHKIHGQFKIFSSNLFHCQFQQFFANKGGRTPLARLDPRLLGTNTWLKDSKTTPLLYLRKWFDVTFSKRQ